MRTHIVAVAALAGSMLLAPTVMQQAKAGHGGGFGGGMGGAHFGGGMSGAHFSGGVEGPHFAGGHMAGAHGGENWHGGQFASRDGGWQGGRHVAWNEGHSTWHGNDWHDHNHLVQDHDLHNRFNHRFVAVELGWPGYYSYGYGYGGCGWLRHLALIIGSPYWWDRYYTCANYY